MAFPRQVLDRPINFAIRNIKKIRKTGMTWTQRECRKWVFAL